jgi:hypothetical protein
MFKGSGSIAYKGDLDSGASGQAQSLGARAEHRQYVYERILDNYF